MIHLSRCISGFSRLDQIRRYHPWLCMLAPWSRQHIVGFSHGICSTASALISLYRCRQAIKTISPLINAKSMLPMVFSRLTPLLSSRLVVDYLTRRRLVNRFISKPSRPIIALCMHVPSAYPHQENNMLLGLLEVLESAGLTGLTRASVKFL